MSREPQTLVWLPTLHRLIATETGELIFHESSGSENVRFSAT